MRTRAPLPLLLLLAACPEQVGQQCPPHTVPVGQYALNFAGQRAPGECRLLDAGADALPDAGVLAVDDGGTSSVALCYGNDGGPAVWLVIPTKGARYSPLLDDGGFQFTGHSEPVPGTRCVCPVGIDETVSGNLISSPDAGFAVLPDGGLPEVTSLTGLAVDQLWTDAGTAGCACALPCTVTWALSGKR